jgi:mono/diheme cytochrome c family protein
MSENVTIEPGQARPTDGLKERTWFRMLPIEQRTMLGTVFFFLTLVVLAFIGVNEPGRMASYAKQYDGRAIQRGASIFRDNCSVCHGLNGEGKEGIAPTLNGPDMFNGTRLKELGYAGSLKDYITLTVSAGRPARSNPDWPNPMPTWSQDYGGPLRPDQINDVVSFVMNWGCAFDEKCVPPDYTPPAPPATAGPTPTLAPTPAPIPPDEIIKGLPAGNPTRGQALYDGTQTLADGKAAGCSACHTIDGTPLVGPSLNGVGKDMPSGYSSEDAYIGESIYFPNVFKVPGFETAQMPLGFFARFHAAGDEQANQDLADLIAFIKSISQ